MAVCLIKTKQYRQAAELAEQAISLDSNHFISHDAASHCHFALGNSDKTRHFGKRALEIRDAKYTHDVAVDFPELPPPPSAETKLRNIISFSLFGALPKYCEMALANAESALTVYPNWTCRFYIDDSVPMHVRQRLLGFKAQVVHITPAHQKLVGTMWRFLALDDPFLHRILFRDADSLLTPAEALAVDEWIKSGTHFHMMRDAGSHTELILAGMWGAVRGSLGKTSTQAETIEQQMQAYMADYDENSHFADQYFLREKVWPIVRQSLLQHDSQFGFLNARPFPTNEREYGLRSIGSTPTDSTIKIEKNVPDGTTLMWQITDANDQPLCEYPATLQKQKTIISIPIHIARRLESQQLKIKVLG